MQRRSGNCLRPPNAKSPLPPKPNPSAKNKPPRPSPHHNKTLTLLRKLDIKKAFDFMHWDFFMDLLRHNGFLSHFHNWVSALLSLASSRMLLNGVAYFPIRHDRGLRQVDPLSSLLFMLAIHPLHHILSKEMSQGKLHPLGRRTPTIWASLCANNAAIFVAPIKDDI